MIYPTLITKIKTTLEGITKVKEVFEYPAQRITKYPAVVFFPDSFDNDFNSTGSNFKIYRFKIWAIANAQQKYINKLYSDVMPNLVDAILAEFDENWDFETIDGHRVWSKIATGGWTLSDEKNGIELTAELDLEIKLLTNN